MNQWLMKKLISILDWDFWVGNPAGEIVLEGKHLFHKWGFRIDLHKIHRADVIDCFHSHPALAIRMPIWGGYDEEIWHHPELKVLRGVVHTTSRRIWCPWDLGIISPGFIHRIDKLHNGPSYSLWIRAPVTHKIKLYGSGWPQDMVVSTHKEE